MGQTSIVIIDRLHFENAVIDQLTIVLITIQLG